MDAATKSTVLCIKGDKVNNPDNCLSTQTFLKNIKTTLDINVYPNPSGGVFNILLNGARADDIFEIEIFNSLGSLVLSFKTNQTALSLDLKYQTEGVYLLKIKGSNFLHTKLLVKE